MVMKIDKKKIKDFEKEQKQYGTETAIHNLIFEIAFELLKAVGVKRIKCFHHSK